MKTLIIATTIFITLTAMAGLIFTVLTTTLGAPIPFSALLVSTAAAAFVIGGIRTVSKASDISPVRPDRSRRRRAVLKCLIIDESQTHSREVIDAEILQ